MTQGEALSILKTGVNVFLTGEPGSGKTYVINEYIRYLKDHDVEVAVTASTGIAATHIGGMTIHSWSGIGIKNKLDKYDLDRLSSNEYVIKRINKTKVLIIDEISMLSASTLSSVEAICRGVRNSDFPFGGIQVIFVGDFFQLPPVVKKNINEESKEQAMFGSDDEALFAYDSSAWQKTKPITCYLSEQYRQDDEDFSSILLAIRNDDFRSEHLEKINSRIVDVDNLPEDVPKLFSHNVNVDFVNTEMLSRIENPIKIFRTTSKGNDKLVQILKNGCLSPEELSLKVGAEVMFTKNNQREGFVNGTLGVVIDFKDYEGYPIVRTKNGKVICVEPMDWNIEENGKIKASISQIPLRLAWAITVHKSQGMSMDSALMDLSQVFEYGQGYVALSRIRRLSGLHIIGLNGKAFKVHPDVLLQDKIFKGESSNAQKVFGNMSPDEISGMQKNFIIASGGKFKEKSKKEKKEKVKGAGFDEVRKKHPNAYRPWKDWEDDKLREIFAKNIPIKEIAKTFGRKTSAIRARLEKLGLLSPSR